MAQPQQLQPAALPPLVPLPMPPTDPNIHLPMAPVYPPTRQNVEDAQNYHLHVKLSHGMLVFFSDLDHRWMPSNLVVL